MIKIRVYLQLAVDDEIYQDIEIDDISQAEDKADELLSQVDGRYYGACVSGWEVIKEGEQEWNGGKS